MSEQSQDKKPKGNKLFILTVLLLMIAITLGTMLFYGIQYVQNKDFQDKASQNKEQKESIIEPTVIPTPVATVKPTPAPTITPAPNEEPISKTPVKVRGIYVTGPRAGSGEAMDDLIHLVDTTEINAMVIDIKNDSGEITYKMNQDTVKEIGAGTAYIHDMKALVKRLKKKNIYLIARIVAFKDPKLAQEKPELSLKTKDGKIFKDDKGLSWVNPYKKEVWDYLVGVASEAAYLGFDEIQFDYIRFSTDSGMKNVNFGKAAKNKSKGQVITEFTKYAYEKLSSKGVFVSADVYGTIIDSQVDAKIVGQDYADMASHLDYICPMVYPSHYADGSYEIAHPNDNPYEIIYNALTESQKALTNSNLDQVAIVRPWLQDFFGYKKKEIKAQIKAVEDAGYEEWILWNASNRYTKEGLLKE